MAPKLETRVALCEAQLKEVRRDLDGMARYGSTPSDEALYRCWQAEREARVALEVLHVQTCQTLQRVQAEKAELAAAIESWAAELEGITFLLRGGTPLEAV